MTASISSRERNPQHGTFEALHRYAEGLFDARQRSEVVPPGELQERPQSGQAQIAAAHRVVAPPFQILEECQDQVWLEIRQAQFSRHLAQAFVREVQKQQHRIPIGRNRVGAHGALGEQIVGEKLLDQRRK